MSETKLKTKDIKKIIEEKNTSSLFNLFNDINKYLNFDEEQILYLINYNNNDNFLINNYYYRRLELRYTSEIIEKLNNINFYLIPLGNPETGELSTRIDNDNRIDIETFAKLFLINIDINNDLRFIIKKKYSINLIINELELKIFNEKSIIQEILIKINENNELIKDNSTITIFKNELEKRLEKIDRIDRKSLELLLIEDDDYNDKREKLKKILNSLLILIDTFIVIIINYGCIRSIYNSQIDDIMNYLYFEVKNAIDCYKNTIADLDINYNENLRIQKKFYYNIINDINNDVLNKIIIYYDNIKEYLINFQKIDSKFIDIYYKKLISEIKLAKGELIIKSEKIRSSTFSHSYKRIRRSFLTRIGLRKPQKRVIIDSRKILNEAIIARRSLNIGKLIKSLDISWEYWERPVIISNNSSIEINKSSLIENESIDNLFKTDYIDVMDDKYKDFFIQIKDNFIEYSKFFKNEKDKQKNYNNLKENYEYFFNDKNRRGGIPTITNYINYSLISFFIRYIQYDKCLKFIDSDESYVCNYVISINDKGEFIDNRQIGIDAGGLRRDFITSLINELFQKNIFINRDDTKCYFLNPNYKLDEYEKYIIKKHLSDIDDNYFENQFIIDFYNYLGLLLSFIIVNDCGLEYHLSSYIISLFFNNDNEKDKDNIMNLIYYINDFPHDFKTLTNLMKEPKQIASDSYMSFNDLYNLISIDKDLDEDNIIEYLYELSKFINKKCILRKNIELSTDINILEYNRLINKNTLMYVCLKNGIPKKIKDDFTNNNFTPMIIKTYLKSPDMSDEIIEKLINNFSNTMEEYYELKKITKLFINYVLRNNNGKHINKDNYHKFIIKLLKFWSGSAFYKDNQKYKIQINENLTIQHLPQSHTCFFLIDIPDYRVLENDEEIGNKLFVSIHNSIFNVEEGIGLAGGSRRRRIRIKRMK